MAVVRESDGFWGSGRAHPPTTYSFGWIHSLRPNFGTEQRTVNFFCSTLKAKTMTDKFVSFDAVSFSFSSCIAWWPLSMSVKKEYNQQGARACKFPLIFCHILPFQIRTHQKKGQSGERSCGVWNFGRATYICDAAFASSVYFINRVRIKIQLWSPSPHYNGKTQHVLLLNRQHKPVLNL